MVKSVWKVLTDSNYVLCEKCKAEYYPASFGDAKKTVAAWNRRPIENELRGKIGKLEGYYTSWQTIYDKLGEIYDEFCIKDEDIVTDENRLSFEYLFVKARCFQDCPIGIEDFEIFFSSVEKRIKEPSLKQEWLKLGKSFKHNIKAHNQKYANDYL